MARKTTQDGYPPITDAECDAFERHARSGKGEVDPNGEGVKYTLIQPYDLVRFCETVRTLRRQGLNDSRRKTGGR